MIGEDLKACLDSTLGNIVDRVNEKIPAVENLTLTKLSEIVKDVVIENLSDNLRPLVQLQCETYPDGTIDVSILPGDNVYVQSSAFH